MTAGTVRLRRAWLVLALFAGCDDAADTLAPRSAPPAAGGAAAAAGTDGSEAGFDSGGAPSGSAGTGSGSGGVSAAGASGEGGEGPGRGGRDGGEAGEPSAAGGLGGVAGAEAGAAGAAGAGDSDALLFDVEVVRASDVDPDAPGTVGIVTFAVDLTEVTEAYVEFGLDRGYGMVAPVDLAEPGFRTLLLGMKPSRTYHFRVVVRDASRSYTSADYTLFTGPPTSAVALAGFSVLAPASREPGFIVGSYWSGATSAVPFILDRDGEIVWWRLGLAGAIARARMSEDGKHMWFAASTNFGAPLRRVGMDGLDLAVFEHAIGSHDIVSVAGSTMAYLEYGESDCDSIFEIDASGVTHEVFESEAVVLPAGTVRCHGNAVRYSAAEDLYTYSEWQQDVLAVTRSGAVAWRLSELVAGGRAAWGGSQHGHHLLSDRLVLFANAGAERASFVVEYSLLGEELRRFPSGGFTANLGDVQRLPGGNTLITYSNAKLVEEVDGASNVVLRIEGVDRFGYLTWRPSLYGRSPDVHD